MAPLAFRRNVIGLALSLALLTPWSAQARPFEHLSGELISWLTILFGDVGCSLDPGGICRAEGTTEPAAVDAQRDVGCSADPNGGGCHD